MTNIGTCIFCGSQVIPERELEQEMANHYAMQICECQGAIRQRQITTANEAIDELCAVTQGEFEALKVEVIQLLKKQAEMLIDRIIDDVTMKLSGEKIKLSTKNGMVVCSRKKELELVS
jgi:Actin-like ATPase involved in cell division